MQIGYWPMRVPGALALSSTERTHLTDSGRTSARRRRIFLYQWAAGGPIESGNSDPSVWRAISPNGANMIVDVIETTGKTVTTPLLTLHGMDDTTQWWQPILDQVNAPDGSHPMAGTPERDRWRCPVETRSNPAARTACLERLLAMAVALGSLQRRSSTITVT